MSSSQWARAHTRAKTIVSPPCPLVATAHPGRPVQLHHTTAHAYNTQTRQYTSAKSSRTPHTHTHDGFHGHLLRRPRSECAASKATTPPTRASNRAKACKTHMFTQQQTLLTTKHAQTRRKRRANPAFLCGNHARCWPKHMQVVAQHDLAVNRCHVPLNATHYRMLTPSAS